MATVQHITTAEELLQTPGLGRCELVHGELIMMSPAGCEHGRIVSRINARIERYVEKHKLGIVTGAETGFRIGRDPDTVLAPDVAFIRADRLTAEPMPGFFPGAPDLAVEVLSPGDRAGEVLAKVQNWLDAGCRAVWVADPATHTVSAFRAGNETVFYETTGELTDEDILPGFKLSVARVFAR
jgi:Uma2 family endonuclease